MLPNKSLARYIGYLDTKIFLCLNTKDIFLEVSNVMKISWRWAQQPTPVFLPGESHGQRSLVGYSPWGHKESNKTEATQHMCTSNLNSFLAHLFSFLILGFTFSFTGEERVGLATGDGI